MRAGARVHIRRQRGRDRDRITALACSSSGACAIPAVIALGLSQGRLRRASADGDAAAGAGRCPPLASARSPILLPIMITQDAAGLGLPQGLGRLRDSHARSPISRACGSPPGRPTGARQFRRAVRVLDRRHHHRLRAQQLVGPGRVAARGGTPTPHAGLLLGRARRLHLDASARPAAPPYQMLRARHKTHAEDDLRRHQRSSSPRMTAQGGAYPSATFNVMRVGTSVVLVPSPSPPKAQFYQGVATRAALTPLASCSPTQIGFWAGAAHARQRGCSTASRWSSFRLISPSQLVRSGMSGTILRG